ncbi:MAG: hypothetical protein ABGZ53_17950 [Fuerstiella sp.]
MKIDILYLDGCPNHQPVVALAEQVVAELRLDADIEEVEVGPDDAERLRFLGSPTVHVNGVDVEPTARGRNDVGFACRTYNGQGMPDREIIMQACLDAAQDDNHD